MKLCFFGLIFLFGIHPAFTQNYTTQETASKKIIKQWERVEHYSAAEHFDDALTELDKILAADDRFIDGYIRYAAIKYTQDKFAEAETYYEKALALDGQYDANLYYQLGLTFYNQDKFAEAVPWLKKFVASNPRRESLQQRAAKYLANAEFAAKAIKNPVPFTPERLPEAINSPDPEYFPSLTADGNALVYTRKTRNQEDLYISRKKDGVWQPGELIPGINTDENEGTQQISADGKFLVFTACNRQESMGGCDIYYSELKNGAWTRPQNIRPPLNTKAWESQPSISANGQALYFASNRDGGFGGSDIYVSYRQADGLWSTPANLGDVINTPGKDQSPFIHPDGRTLYFMSDGHPAIGGTDLFMAKLADDGTWSKPVNLGYPINTKTDESALIVSLDGKTAYFSMVEPPNDTDSPFPTRVDVNIYTFELPTALRPDPVTYVQARVFDAATKQPLVANVEFTNLRTGKIYAASMTDDEGEFLVCLPMNNDFALNVNKKAYLFHSENFSLSTQAALTEPFLLEIGLVPIPKTISNNTEFPSNVNQPIILRNVFFETGSAALLPTSLTELNRLKKLLEENPGMKIRINGHTDNVGADADNLKLSEQRASAVYNFLAENGIAEDRLSFKGFGEKQPIDTNDTPAGRQRNRRTEFEMMK